MRDNLAVARGLARQAGPGPARIWAVVKANGYGHGLRNALEGFADADGLALIEFDLASRLRTWGWERPILMLEGAFDTTDVLQAREQGLALVVHDEAQLRWLESCGSTDSGRLDVWLKCNTGMNRLGFPAVSIARLHAKLRALPVVRSVGLMTHFANSDLPGGAGEAIEAFGRATEGLVAARSLANSAALIDLPVTRADWVRPGVMLYGGSPFASRSAGALGLRAAMRLKSRIIAIQQLSPGDAVGYGSIFRADRPMRIGVVACGYADGYPRHAPNGTPVAVDGIRTGTLGRVAMDMLMVDLAPVPSATVGSEVELWGDRVPIDEVAAAAGTIGYELMCALAPRVPVEVID